MTATSADVFDQGLDFFDGVVSQVAPDQWDNPSPCADWTALDVVGHLCTSLGMGTSILKGEQPTWPDAQRPADLVQGDPAAHYRAAADGCRQALVGADLDSTRETPMGTRTVAEGLAFPALDLFIHGWDLAQSTGQDVAIPDHVIEFGHTYLDPIPQDKMRGPGGAFGPEVAAPEGASSSDAFLAWTGRTPIV